MQTQILQFFLFILNNTITREEQIIKIHSHLY